VTKKRKFFS